MALQKKYVKSFTGLSIRVELVVLLRQAIGDFLFLTQVVGENDTSVLVFGFLVIATDVESFQDVPCDWHVDVRDEDGLCPCIFRIFSLLRVRVGWFCIESGL